MKFNYDDTRPTSELVDEYLAKGGEVKKDLVAKKKKVDDNPLSNFVTYHKSR